MSNLEIVLQKLIRGGDANKAAQMQRFFKTGEGQYGAGDVFLGLSVPQVRNAVKECAALELDAIRPLFDSKFHEVRLFACLLLERQYKKDKADSANVIQCYLENLPKMNNWDLVDAICYKVLGHFLLDKSKDILFTLARSSCLWEQRASVVSTMALIKAGQLDDAFALCQLHLNHPHDLMHKAVGWMLRECGEQDGARLRAFLTCHIKALPRTALRYAIEHFSAEERRLFLQM